MSKSPPSPEDFEAALTAAKLAAFSTGLLIRIAVEGSPIQGKLEEILDAYRSPDSPPADRAQMNRDTLVITIEGLTKVLKEHAGKITVVRSWLHQVVVAPVQLAGISEPTVHELAWTFANQVRLDIKRILFECGNLDSSPWPDLAQCRAHWEPIRDYLRSLGNVNTASLEAGAEIESSHAVARFASFGASELSAAAVGSTSAEHGDSAKIKGTCEEIVLLIHGIRTFAHWQPMVKRVLEEIPGNRVIPIGYGYLDAFRFWFPIGTRQRQIDEVRRELQNARAANPNARISVIAHSFGTYAISRILHDTPDLMLHRLVLCGSIVPRKYRWDHVAKLIETQVINDYGTRDIWPVLAQCLSWGYGDTGRHGFRRGAKITDRGHDYKHSEFFNEDFVRTFWKPWFEYGKMVQSAWPEKAPPPSRALTLLSWAPLQWISTFLFISLLVWLFVFLPWEPEGPAARLHPNRTDAETAKAAVDMSVELRNWDEIPSDEAREKLLEFTDRFILCPQYFASKDLLRATAGRNLDLDIRRSGSGRHVILRDIVVEVVGFHSVAPTFTVGASIANRG